MSFNQIFCGCSKLKSLYGKVKLNQSLRFVTILLFALSSCVPFKDIPLINETAEGSYDVQVPEADYKLKKADLLNIDVKILNKSVTDILSPQQNQAVQGGGAGTGSAMIYFTGYLIDQNGKINIPKLGEFVAEGKTTAELEVEVEDKLSTLYKTNEVTIRLSNFRITLAGELGSPGVQYIYERNYNLLQAITNAGGFTDFSNRKKIRLMRETDKGLKTIWLDMTNPKTLSSKYFYLQPNDMLYVEPLKAKYVKSNLQNIGIGISIVSLITTVVALFSR